MYVYRAYANAIELQPDSALYWHNLAVGYLYLGQVLLNIAIVVAVI
jgi:hypothetical protein